MGTGARGRHGWVSVLCGGGGQSVYTMDSAGKHGRERMPAGGWAAGGKEGASARARSRGRDQGTQACREVGRGTGGLAAPQRWQESALHQRESCWLPAAPPPAVYPGRPGSPPARLRQGGAAPVGWRVRGIAGGWWVWASRSAAGRSGSGQEGARMQHTGVPGLWRGITPVFSGSGAGFAARTSGSA